MENKINHNKKNKKQNNSSTSVAPFGSACCMDHSCAPRLGVASTRNTCTNRATFDAGGVFYLAFSSVCCGRKGNPWFNLVGLPCEHYQLCSMVRWLRLSQNYRIYMPLAATTPGSTRTKPNVDESVFEDLKDFLVQLST